MPKKPASPADIFLNAASARVDEKEQARLRQEAEKRKAEIARQKDRERQERALKKAFPEYYKSVAPLLKAMESLPPKDGEEFFVRADLHLGEHYKTRVPTQRISVWVLYTGETKNYEDASGRPCRHSLSINRKGAAADDDSRIDLALNGRSVLRLELDTDETGKVSIKSHTYDESYEYAYSSRSSGCYVSTSRGTWRQYSPTADHAEHAGISGFAAALGKWVQDTAPGRLPDIAAALGAGAAKIPTERMAVSRPIRLAAKPPQ